MYDTYVRLFKAPEPRYKLLRVSLGLFLEGTLFNTRLSPDGGAVHAVEIEGLPADARAEALSYDQLRDHVLVRVWSSEFPLLEVCEPAPEMDLVIRSRVFAVLEPRPDGMAGAGVDGEVVEVSPPERDGNDQAAAAAVGIYEAELTPEQTAGETAVVVPGGKWVTVKGWDPKTKTATVEPAPERDGHDLTAPGPLDVFLSSKPPAESGPETKVKFREWL
jgi:hypothetical protein